MRELGARSYAVVLAPSSSSSIRNCILPHTLVLTYCHLLPFTPRQPHSIAILEKPHLSLPLRSSNTSRTVSSASMRASHIFAQLSYLCFFACPLFLSPDFLLRYMNAKCLCRSRFMTWCALISDTILRRRAARLWTRVSMTRSIRAMTRAAWAPVEGEWVSTQLY